MKNILLWEHSYKSVWEKILEIIFIRYFNFTDKLVTDFYSKLTEESVVNTRYPNRSIQLKYFFIYSKKLFFHGYLNFACLQKSIIKRIDSQTYKNHLKFKFRRTLTLVYEIKHLIYQDIVGPILIQVVTIYNSFLHS